MMYLWQSLYVSKDQYSYQVVSKSFWWAMTLGVAFELIIGLATILFVPVSRSSGIIPKKGSSIYFIHALAGFILAMGGMYIFIKAFFAKHPYQKLALIGLIGLFIAGVGGAMTVFKELRLPGMAIMLIATPIAFFSYLTPTFSEAPLKGKDSSPSSNGSTFQYGSKPEDISVNGKLRQVARVVFIDSSASVLLLSAVDPSDPKHSEFWYTPGGGAKKGEDFKDAARREVFEETGYVLGDIDDPVLERRTTFKFDGRDFDQFEKYFFVSTERFEVQPKKLSDLEKRSITGYRWWRIDELLAANAVFYPNDLSRLVANWLITRR